MSRCFEQYSPDEKVNVLQFSLHNTRGQVNDLEEKVWMLKTEMSFLMESISKLPRKEREITIKRFERLRKSFLKEIEQVHENETLATVAFADS